MSELAKDDIALLRLVGEEIRKTLIKPPYCMEGTGCELPPCGCSQEAGKAALAAIRAAGWAVVPVEPTPQMARCGIEGADIRWSAASLSECLTDDEVSSIYRAMLAAAPGVKP
jgi:hypothetical protein